MARYAHIVGWGKYLPERVLTNGELEKLVNTSDDWIQTRTGILQRHIADPKETTSALAVKAGRQALQVAGLSPRRLELIIVATISPDHIFPATACWVQDALGASHAVAFDLNAGCSGFVYALDVARHLIVAGAYKNVLVVGAEVMSRFLDWEDRSTCVLFGDGAGAVVLAASNAPGGVLACSLGADGSGGNMLLIPAGGSRLPANEETLARRQHFVKMNGREVYRFATHILPRSTREVLGKAGLELEDVELLIPHQANQRITLSAAKSLGFGEERVFSNVSRYGNTSAASIPIALCEAIEEGKVKPGDHIVLVGFGAGLTWGAALLQWSEVPLRAKPSPARRTLARLIYPWANLRSGLLRLYRRLDAIWCALVKRLAQLIGKAR